MYERIRDVAKGGDVSMNDIATLCAVTRQSLYNYKTGGPTNRLIKDRAERMISLMEKAITLGYLPLKKKGLNTAEKLVAIKRVLHKSIDK